MGIRSRTVAVVILACAAAAQVAAAPLASAAPPAWIVQPTTNPAGASASNVLQAVSCPVVTACLAVGFTKTGSVATAMAEAWNGTSWTTTAPAAPPGALASDLQAVSCVSAAACTAVGLFRDATGAQHVLAERWDGTSWTREPAPDPAGSRSAGLDGVSCVSVYWCEAVGSYVYQPTSSTTDLAEIWNGQAWTVQPTQAAFSEMDFELSSVSCSSPAMCMATGQSVSRFGGTTHTATWAEQWNGTTWSGQLPDVEGIRSSLTAVSCVTATAICTAVGWYDSTTSAEYALAERWNGVTWSLQSPASASTIGAMTFTGISCPSAVACIAVGYAQVTALAPGTLVTVAQSWNGATWTLGGTPDVAGVTILTGVSCPSATVCTGVGWAKGLTSAGPRSEVTVAERYS